LFTSTANIARLLLKQASAMVGFSTVRFGSSIRSYKQGPEIWPAATKVNFRQRFEVKET
jgi:hypothetical protein